MGQKKAQPYEELSEREHDVAQLMSEGHSNKIIAAKLNITPHTAKFHVMRIITKMNAQSRVDASVKFVVMRMTNRSLRDVQAVLVPA